MKFASAKQAILLIIVTCAGLYALDYYKNPQLWHHESQEMKASGKGARLALWMNHLCCTGWLAGRRPDTRYNAGDSSTGPTARLFRRLSSPATRGAVVSYSFRCLDRTDQRGDR